MRFDSRLSLARPTVVILTAAMAMLAGCQKTTTTETTPEGTARTTTVAPTAGTAATIDRAADNVGRAAAKTGEAVADSAITAKVKTALLADPDVKGLQIDVDTHDGVVKLSGTLDQKANADRAEAIARKTEGVKSVENQLAVK